MSQSHHPKSANSKNGFTLMEVMVSLVVLTVGVMSAALLMGNVYKNTVRSRYMAMAAALASEKLEDLGRFSISDPRGNAAGGSLNPLSPGTPQTILWNGNGNVLVDYYDTVTMNSSTGTMSETRQVLTSGGATEFTTQQFTADGIWHWDTTSGYPSPPASTASNSGVTFLRLWTIQQDTPVQYSELVTVKVFLEDDTVQPPVSFQMSMVRPSQN